MRLTFKLRFHTAPGDSLWLAGDHEIFGSNDPGKEIPLQYVDAKFWQVTLVLPRNMAPDADIAYHYIWRHASGSISEDWGVGRTVNPATVNHDELLIVDSWNHPGFYENAFYTEPFRGVLLRCDPAPAGPQAQPSLATHTFRVKAPLLEKGQTICLLGNCSGLSSWDTHNPVLLNKQSCLALVLLDAIWEFVKSVAVKLDYKIPGRAQHVALQNFSGFRVDNFVICVDRYACGKQLMP